MIYHRLIGVASALLILSTSSAQTLTDSVAVHFRQSKTTLDTTYMNNGKAFEHIKDMVKRYNRPDSDLLLKEIKITGGASPEGSVKFNNYLSKKRGTNIFDYIHSKIEVPDSLTEQIILGRDWRGLRQQVMADTNVPYREEVIKLLDEIITLYDNGEKETSNNLQRLKRLRGGRPYLYMYRKIFPGLRQANVVLVFGQPKLPLQPKQMPLSEDSLFLPLITPEIPAFINNIHFTTESKKPIYIALKSNMLADILALPEIGAEFYVGKNLSVVGNWMYGWWDKDKTHRYWRAYGGDLALRWWFGKAAHKKPLTGHHVGLYGGLLTYDFEFGGKGHMGGRPGHNLWDRCMHYVGMEYGYSLPVARRLNIDFTFGMGYMGGKYVEYEPKGRCYVWEATKQKHWIGPTKIEISLVWLIGRGNYNTKGATK